MPIAHIRDSKGDRQEVKLDLSVYQAAASEGLSVSQYVNRKFDTDEEKFGTAFDQMCESSGLLLKPNKKYGIKSPSLADVFSGKAMLGQIGAATVADADPASRLLYPAAVIQMIEDKLAVDRTTDANFFDQMVGNDITVPTNRYEQPIISYTKVEKARRQAISQLAEPARMLTITAADKMRTIPTESIGLEVSDQALQATTLDLVGRSLARYREVERLEVAYDYLKGFLNGDDDNGDSALVQTKADTLDSTIVAAGAVTKKALVGWLWRNYYKRRIDWIVTDLDNAFAIETAMQSTHTGNYPTPGMAPTFNLVNRVFSELKVFVVDPQFNWPANTLMGFDSRNAITRVTNVSAAYSAVESFVLRRSTVMRIDTGEFCHRTFDDSYDTLSLTLTSGS